MPYIVEVDGKKTQITLNCKPMFDWAIGKPLETLDNRTGRDIYHDLWPAVAQIYRPDDLEVLVAMEAKNGYGTVDDARHFLIELLELASNNASEIFSVQSAAPKIQTNAGVGNTPQLTAGDHVGC